MAVFCRVDIILVILSVVLLPTTTKATQYVVGDDSGWTIDFDYQAWAKNKVFKVGDQLVFIYPQGVHNVYQVNGSAFASCSEQGEALTSGHDIVTLTTPGQKWYICGVEDHCAEFNQKLTITVQK